MPAKLEVLQSCIFRHSNPCIAGLEVLEGRVKTGDWLITSKGNKLTVLKSMQRENENVSKAKKKDQIAAQLPNIMAGRHLNEADIIYTDMSEDDFRTLKRLKEYLTQGDVDVLKEIVTLKRKQNPLWGV